MSAALFLMFPVLDSLITLAHFPLPATEWNHPEGGREGCGPKRKIHTFK